MLIDYKERLNPEQYEAVTATEGPVLIIAGAGTGKTATLVHRVAYLIESGVPAETVLLLTFTNKAAREMKARANAMLNGMCSGITACTYHSFCVRMLRRYAAQAGLSPSFTILSSGDEADAVGIVESELGITRCKGFPKNAEVASMISMAVNKGLSLRAVLATKKFRKYMCFEQELGKIRERLAAYKQENNMVNYDDMLVLFDRLLSARPDICKEISDGYRYIMIDEYQDTNRLQDEIIRKLRQENRNIAVVGDDLQSLYGFRGAEVQNIIRFPERWEDCRTIYLTKNYRSSQEILDLSNKAVEHATEGFKKVLTGLKHNGVQPSVIHTADQNEEAGKALDLIQLRHAQGTPYNEICVLMRGSAQSFTLEARLEAAGIPFVKYGGLKFLERAHVRDVLAYLRVIVNPRDELAWFRILQNMEGVGKAYAKKIAGGCKEEGKSHLLSGEYAKRKFHHGLGWLYSVLEPLHPDDLEQCLNTLLPFYHDLCEQLILNMNTTEFHREELLAELESHDEDLAALRGMAEPYASAVKFLDDLSLDNTQEDEGEGSVILSTIHSAKGLEFDSVIVLDCVDGICPSTSMEEAGSKEDNEELRCFYVAITRAKEHLYLICPELVLKYGQPLYVQPSHFLNGAEDTVKISHTTYRSAAGMY